MQLRENARPMTDEEFDAWMKRQEDINWALGSDGRPDSSPGVVAWFVLAIGMALIAFAAGIYWFVLP